MKKPIYKSKTFWIQCFSVVSILNIPEIRGMYCQNPEESVSFVAVLTIAARYFGSNIGKDKISELRLIKIEGGKK